MTKHIHYDPSSEDIHAFHMKVRSDDNHNYYKIHLSELSEGQRKRLGQRFGISLKILESEPYLTLVRITGI